MIYEVLKPATGLEVGETFSLDELAKKGDVNNLIRKGVVRAVGFLSAGSPVSDSEAGKMIAELQKKYETAEDERDQAREELKTAKRQIRALEEGHKEGAKQLQAANEEITNLRSELDKRPVPSKGA